MLHIDKQYLTKYLDYLGALRDLKPSGCPETEYRDKGFILYHEGEQDKFKWLNCADILAACPKWHTAYLDKNNDEPSDDPVSSLVDQVDAGANTSEDGDVNTNKENRNGKRPMGSKKSKEFQKGDHTRNMMVKLMQDTGEVMKEKANAVQSVTKMIEMESRLIMLDRYLSNSFTVTQVAFGLDFDT
jgi:hypothetical protein